MEDTSKIESNVFYNTPDGKRVKLLVNVWWLVDEGSKTVPLSTYPIVTDDGGKPFVAYVFNRTK